MINWIEQVPRRPPGGLVVVVDGGATHSRVAVATPEGDLVGYADGAATNGRSVGDDVATANLAAGVGAALSDGGVEPSDVTYCLVTSASIDTLVQSERMSAAVRPLVGDAVVGTVPDPMGCWASTNALGPGVGVIAGTGSVVVAADRGRSLWRRYGGWDYILGDEGSGYGLGRAALREAMLFGEGRSDAAELVATLMASDGVRAREVTDIEGLLDGVHKPFVDKAWIASFAPIVLDLADAGDEPSLRILRSETGVLAEAAATAVDVIDESVERVVVGLFGGTFVSSAQRETFIAGVRERSERPVELVVPEHSALVGAFTIALGWGDDATAGADVEAAERIERANDRLTDAVMARRVSAGAT